MRPLRGLTCPCPRHVSRAGPSEAPSPGCRLAAVPVPEQTHERYERVFSEVEAPFAFVDLDAMWANAADMARRAGGKPIRLASKSVRCRALLERMLARGEGFAGLLTFTLPETLWLASEGFEDLLLAYPTADRGALAELAVRSAANPEAAPAVMVDCVEHLELIESVLGAAAAPVRVCIDVDAGWWALGGRVKVGPKRSPVHTAADAVALAREIEGRPQLRLVALMAYEGQIAGVGDRPPGRRPARRGDPLHAAALGAGSCAERRGEIVAAVREVAEIELVNGGGTGSLELTAADESVTELAAGSGLYAPALFDHYSRFTLDPGGGLRPAGRPPPRARRGHGARRRLPRLGQRRRGATALALAARGAAARPRGGRRRGADPAAGRSGGRAARSATASTSATPRRGSCASASTRSTWSRAARSSIRSRPTAARGEPFSSGQGRARGSRTRWRRPGRGRAGRGQRRNPPSAGSAAPGFRRSGSGACPNAAGRRRSP